MFESVGDRFQSIFTTLRGKGRLSERDVDETLRAVRLALLEADVNILVVKELLARIRARAVGADIRKSLSPAQQVIKVVHAELVHTLGQEAAPLAPTARPPLVILIAGLQGAGKTITAAKLGHRLAGQQPLLIAADLRRPAAIEQLEMLGARAGIPVFSDRASKPLNVVKQGLREADRQGHGVVIIDTGGRLQVDQALMSELADLKRAADPDEVLLVLDAMTGQEAVSVATAFADRTQVTGFVLTKLDGDARGGAAISIREVTGKPIKFAGTGERLEDLEVFHPERIASRILGMGDVLTLIEKAEAAFDAEEAEALAAKMRSADLTLEDFLQQLSQVRKMGPMRDLIAMLPGAGRAIPDVDEGDVSRVEAIIQSMTPSERQDPGSINGSRRRRIASGSGTSPQDVNNLLRQFAQAQKMMRQLTQGRGLPGLAELMGRK